MEQYFADAYLLAPANRSHANCFENAISPDDTDLRGVHNEVGVEDPSHMRIERDDLPHQFLVPTTPLVGCTRTTRKGSNMQSEANTPQAAYALPTHLLNDLLRGAVYPNYYTLLSACT